MEMCSLFHLSFQGLNFQLAAVLLSLGFYSYVEMSKFNVMKIIEDKS